MRCKNNCGAVTRTPARVETYKKWQLCRKCAIEKGLVVNNGYNVRKGSSIRWRKGLRSIAKPLPLTIERRNKRLFDSWKAVSF
jgi:hypothetical protein